VVFGVEFWKFSLHQFHGEVSGWRGVVEIMYQGDNCSHHGLNG
jgi:hypothetical protein